MQSAGFRRRAHANKKKWLVALTRAKDFTDSSTVQKVVVLWRNDTPSNDKYVTNMYKKTQQLAQWNRTSNWCEWLALLHSVEWTSITDKSSRRSAAGLLVTARPSARPRKPRRWHDIAILACHHSPSPLFRIASGLCSSPAARPST